MVIRMRHTRAHTANRRSHHALKAPTLATCSNCAAKQRPHHMCQECGFYKGRMVIDMQAKHEARAARMQAKKDAIKSSRGDEAVQPESTPGEKKDVSLDKINTVKSKAVESPELPQAKTTTPRKGQAS